MVLSQGRIRSAAAAGAVPQCPPLDTDRGTRLGLGQAGPQACAYSPLSRAAPAAHHLPSVETLGYLLKDILLSVFRSVYSGHWMRWQLRSREAGDKPPPSREGQECMLTAGGHARGLWEARTRVRPQAVRSPGCRWGEAQAAQEEGPHSSQPSQDLTHGAGRLPLGEDPSLPPSEAQPWGKKSGTNSGRWGGGCGLGA